MMQGQLFESNEYTKGLDAQKKNGKSNGMKTLHCAEEDSADVPTNIVGKEKRNQIRYKRSEEKKRKSYETNKKGGEKSGQSGAMLHDFFLAVNGNTRQ